MHKYGGRDMWCNNVGLLHTPFIKRLFKYPTRNIGHCDGLSMYVPHRLMYLNAWPIRSSTVRRYSLIEGSETM